MATRIRRYHLTATFDQAKVPYRIQELSLTASTLPTAVARGLRAMLRRKGIARKHHHRITLTVRIGPSGAAAAPAAPQVTEGGDDGQAKAVDAAQGGAEPAERGERRGEADSPCPRQMKPNGS